MRPLTEAEKTTKVSKEVQQLRSFEESLLANYKAFISSLVSIIKSARSDEKLGQLSLLAVTCASSLLIAVPHFNFRTDLLKIIVSQLSRRTVNESFKKCHEALQTLFNDDEDGKASLEAVSMLSKMVKTRNYKVHPTVSLALFNHS